MNHLDLFSGIGGFALGLQRAGFNPVAFCEIDLYCQWVLMEHWAKVPIFTDIHTLNPSNLREAIGDEKIDIITAGFPCQDVSSSGKKGHATDPRTGLWSEAVRLVREFRPTFLLMENVTGLLVRGFGEVLRGLASIGYDAEWQCISHRALGGFQLRNRVWLLAYPEGERRGSVFQQSRILSAAIEDSSRPPCYRRTFHAPDAGRILWETEPSIRRVVDGIPARLDRLRGLGNAVVPQVVEMIGHAIMEAHYGQA